ncbi:S24 family peptidase [Rubellimicrobium sp. CFH 75288]|uniref:S24 family peptidase n=1 Tax=Rubellimicrobium sp. CFH 75288 TaxID=2697034 RepID=UPI0014133A1C|nr:S24 family peptidase [Rubellimicrobium sp. CFH 75288]NAZ37184.1 hypothetical protein [Rubellimicrobium sp. CFH 75288]
MVRRMEETGIKVPELARRSGVSRDAIYKLLQRPGGTTSADRARRIAAVLGMEDEAGLHPPSPADTALIPIYDVRASAGPGQIPDEYVAVTDRVSFAMDYIRRVIRADPRRLALITVAGDSMRPLLEDGDLVLIDMGRTVPDVEGLYVFRHGETIHIKRMIRSARAGHVWALPENPAYPREEYPLDAISVIGRVVWAGGAL